MAASNYGSKYWGIGVNKSLSADGWMSTNADSVTISPTGDLIFMNHGGDGATWPGLIIAKGQWLYCHAASVIDGGMITVDYVTTSQAKASQSERHKMTQSLRYDVLHRDGYRCALCGRDAVHDGVKLHVDHIVPVAKGGKTEPGNLRALCSDCNHGKSDKIPNEDNQ